MSKNPTTSDVAVSIIVENDPTAAALVATIRAAVNGIGKYAAYVEAHNVTRENVKDHATALAALVYPNDKPVQKADGKRTRFGNAVQAAGKGLRQALAPVESDPAETRLIVSLTGPDGGKIEITREMDSMLYSNLVSLIANGGKSA